MYWYLRTLKKYAVFSGRAQRKEYWMFYLFNFFILLIIAAIFIIFYLLYYYDIFTGAGFIFIIISAFVFILYNLVLIIPSIAITVRRLHDIGKSGMMLLVLLIPLVGWVWLLLLLTTKGDSDNNKYGKYPKIRTKFY